MNEQEITGSENGDGIDWDDVIRDWTRTANAGRPKWSDEQQEDFIAKREREVKNNVTVNPASLFTPLDVLLDEPDEEIKWIVDGLLPSSGFSIMAAKPKVGKSTLARQLALAVARGDLFMNRQTAKGAVLYVALEEKRGEVKNHFKLLGATGSEELYSYIGSAPEEASKWLEKEIKNRKPVLVIIDTLFRFVNITDGNDYAKVTAALTPLLSLARDNGAHLMVIHHARKGGGDGGDLMLGSTAIFGSVDTAIILKRSEGKRTIETQQRYGVDMEPTVLVFDEATKIISLGGTKEEDDTCQIAESIMQYLDSRNDHTDEPTINAEIEGRNGLKRKALRDLVANGHIHRSGGGKKGNPFLYSRSLVPDICAEQEKQETKTVENADSASVFSRSRDLPFQMGEHFGDRGHLRNPDQPTPPVDNSPR